MTTFIETILFSFSITGPILFILVLGVSFKHYRFVDKNFIDLGAKLVFNVTLPCLLFINISQSKIAATTSFKYIAVGLIMTVVAWLILELMASKMVEPASDRGVVVQGGFRSNVGIIGLAYCVNAYGDKGLVTASLYLALVTILYNVLSVITLSRSQSQFLGIGYICKGIVKNPLIIGIVLALPFAWNGVEIPLVIIHTGEYLAQMTLPLALICTGASLNFHSLKHDLRNALISTVSRLILVPLMMAVTGILLGLRGVELGVLVLMSCAPTAAVSYAMVRSMGGNSSLAANIIVLTTLGSLLCTSVAITLLRGFELI